MNITQLHEKEQKREALFAENDPDAESSKFKKKGGVLLATNLDEAV